MKLTATPLLAGNNAPSFCIKQKIQPREFVNLLDQHKALIFQGTTDVLSTEDFGRFLVDLKLEHYPYIGGAAPRTIIPVQAGKDIVFTANESPPDQPIPFHHELAQTPCPPEYIFFYCETPCEKGRGGQTPIIDSTAVYRFAKENHPAFIEKLQTEGARYIRTLPAVTDPDSPIGRSYQQTWNVSNKEELEEKLSRIEGCSWEWIGEDVRITSEAVPAVRLVGEHVENFVFQHVFANSIIAAYLGWQDCRNDRHEALLFGDGSKMDSKVLDSISKFMNEHRVLYDWKKGDIMALNNRLVMHSREPFEGPRRVFASIWGQPAGEIRDMQPPNGVSIGTRPPLSPLKTADPLIFGFWKVDKSKCAEVCYQAIASGYRRLDCACDYGNEEEVGNGIAKAIQDGLCTREDLFITSKLWNTYHHPDHVSMALDRTLQDLQLTYVDEYLIHFPISMEYVPFESKYPPEWTNMEGKMVIVPNDMNATWKAMEQLVDKGLARTIGICNFSTQLIRQVLAVCRIRPTTLQVELHPHNSQQNLVRFAREAGMRVTAFSVLGASSYLELGMAEDDDVLLKDKSILNIAAAKCKSPAQVLLRWALQRNTMPLCKTSSRERMDENRNVFDFYLTPVEMEVINALNKSKRYNDPGVFCELGMGTFCPIYE